MSALLANVSGEMNAILIEGDAVGPTLHYGAGAGAEPTASSVVADIVEVFIVVTCCHFTPLEIHGACIDM